MRFFFLLILLTSFCYADRLEQINTLAKKQQQELLLARKKIVKLQTQLNSTGSSLSKAEKSIEMFKAEAQKLSNQLVTLQGENDSLKAKIVTLQKDNLRYRWIISVSVTVLSFVLVWSASSSWSIFLGQYIWVVRFGLPVLIFVLTFFFV